MNVVLLFIKFQYFMRDY